MICTKCQQDKDVLLFSRNCRSKTGYSYWCKACYRDWQIANSIHLKKYWRQYHIENAETAKERRRAYYLAHRDEAIARAAEWQAKNPDKVRACRTKWRREHKDIVNHHTRTRRTRMRGAEIGLTKAQWGRLVEFSADRCSYCGGPMSKSEADHLIPVVNGGGYVWGNVFPVCRSCNAQKSDIAPVAFLGIRKYGELLVSCH